MGRLDLLVYIAQRYPVYNGLRSTCLIHLRNLPSPIPFLQPAVLKKVHFQCCPFSVGIVPFSLPVRVYRAVPFFPTVPILTLTPLDIAQNGS